MKSFYEMCRIVEGYYDDDDYDRRKMPYSYHHAGLSMNPNDWDDIGRRVFKMGEDFDYLQQDGYESYGGLAIEVEYENEPFEYGIHGSASVDVPMPVSWSAKGSLEVYQPEWKEGDPVQRYPNPGRHLEGIPAETRNNILGLIKNRMDSNYSDALKYKYSFDFMPNGEIRTHA